MAADNVVSNLLSERGGGLPTVPSWADLPGSPSDGDLYRVDWSGIGHGTIVVRYDNGRSSWVLADTGGALQSLPLTKGGSVNSDLLVTSTSGAPSVSVSSGVITVDHQADSEVEEWLGELPFVFPLCGLVRLSADLNGTSDPSSSSGFGGASAYLGGAPGTSGGVVSGLAAYLFVDGRASSPWLEVDEYDSSETFQVAHAQTSGVSRTAIHTTEARVADFSDADSNEWAGHARTVSNGGATATATAISRTEDVSGLVGGVRSFSESAVDVAVSVDLHAMEVQI